MRLPILRCQVLHVERAIVFVELHRADGHAFFFQRFPGREIRVVVEQREHDLVAGAEFAPERAAHGESQRRHVRAENDFIRIAIQKIAHRRPRFRDHAVGVAAGVVSAARVGVVARQIIRDGVNHPLRHLRATRPVQKNRRMSVRQFARAQGTAREPRRGRARWTKKKSVQRLA